MTSFNILFPNGFTFATIDLYKLYELSKIALFIQFFLLYSQYIFNSLIIISISFILFKLYKINQTLKGGNTKQYIYLCKYHKNYKAECELENNRCMAIKRNGDRCNQLI